MNGNRTGAVGARPKSMADGLPAAGVRTRDHELLDDGQWSRRGFGFHDPKDTQVPVAQDCPPSGSGIGIETATASGSEWGMSSNLNSRKPTASLRLASGCAGSPHCGQTARYAAAAGGKRNRQPGQQTWVIAEPFIRWFAADHLVLGLRAEPCQRYRARPARRSLRRRVTRSSRTARHSRQQRQRSPSESGRRRPPRRGTPSPIRTPRGERRGPEGDPSLLRRP
jgi:hypothetical protein